MKLLALIEGNDHVCWRYRLAAMQSAFAERGWELKPLVLASGVLPFTRQLSLIAQADGVVLQRRLLAWWKLKLLRRAARRLVFDLDDAVFLRDNNSPRPPESRARWRRFRATVRAADLVTAGNLFLVDAARRCLGPELSDRALHVPTVVNSELYPVASHQRSGKDAQLVWIGSRSTMTALAAVQAALAAAAARIGRLQLKVICDTFPTIPSVEVIACPWTEATETAELAAADIGVSWLPAHPWSEGKCGLKVLQYMAAGLPVVANPVALHTTLVVDGQTGLLAETPGQWAAAIEHLASSPALRKRMGEAARTLVEREYSTTAWGARLASYVDAVCGAQIRRAA